MDNRAELSRTVTVQVVTILFENLAATVCTACEVPGDFSQPDPIRTDRFLATCCDCGGWFIVQHEEGAATAQVVSLNPIATELDRDATPPRPTDG